METEGLAELQTLFTAYLTLVPLLIAIYGIFYSLYISSMQAGAPGDVSNATYKFGQICWGMLALCFVVTLLAAELACSTNADIRAWVLIIVYLLAEGALVYASLKVLKVKPT